MSDTFFTASPHWTRYILPYFFVGGIAGGAYFIAALLQWFGRPVDRPVIRTGYSLAFWGAIISGALLTFDLGKPFRFWHMLFQSENFPNLMFKSWSPISFGAWAILLFGACAAVSWYGSRAIDGPPKGGALLAKLVAGLATHSNFQGSIVDVRRQIILAYEAVGRYGKSNDGRTE